MRTPLHQFFSHEEFQSRLDGVRARMDERGLDALLLTTPENIYYLTGYQTPGYYFFIGLIVPLTGDLVLVPPPHEESLVASYSVVEDYRLFGDTEDPIIGIAGVLDELGLARGDIGVEHDDGAGTEQVRHCKDSAKSVRLAGHPVVRRADAVLSLIHISEPTRPY